MSDYALHRLLIPIYVQFVYASRGFMLRAQHSRYAVTEWLRFRSKLKLGSNYAERIHAYLAFRFN